jgi:hypothetical protein
MGKSSQHISDSDSNVSDDSSPEGISLRVAELENTLSNQDKLLGKVFHENKKLNLEFESSFSEIASLRSAYDDMSVKPCDRCTMIMVNYADRSDYSIGENLDRLYLSAQVRILVKIRHDLPRNFVYKKCRERAQLSAGHSYGLFRHTVWLLRIFEVRLRC